MSNLSELRNERLKKLAELKRLGVDPYPAKSYRTITNAEIRDGFDTLSGKDATIAGRIISVRGHGKLTFMDVKDSSGKIQLYIKSDALTGADHAKSELNFDELNLLDLGDFVEASGAVVKTKIGEVSIEVKKLRLLTKTLRPMPSNWDGLSDKETRLRRRYLDTNINPEVYSRFIRRSKFWQATRDFMNKKGFVEINIPVLEHTTGGADAKPFTTHMDTLDQDFYLRISHELPLKRLIGGGYEKVYDIGPRFRNEGYSDEHLPEHVAFESYAAYEDYEDGMKFYERMIKVVAQETWGKLQFENVNGFKINLDQKWPVVRYQDIMKKRFDVDVFNPDFAQLKKILTEHKVKLDGKLNVTRAMDAVWKIIRRESAGPFWLIHEPVSISPLAKHDPKDPRVAERFHPVIAGTEVGNGFSELNDPIDQLNRFMEQQEMREGGDEEAQMLDIDFVEMLEYGMPPTCGWGHSERFFWMFEGVNAKEGVPFPPLRFEVNEDTKEIYPEVFNPSTRAKHGAGLKEKSAKKAKPADKKKKIITILKAIIFDWHGVLDRTDFNDYAQKISEITGRNFNEVVELIKPYDREAILNKMGPLDFWNKMKDLFSLDETALSKVKDTVLKIVPNESLWLLLPELNKKYKLAVLSDAAIDKIELIRKSANLGYFDETYFSAEKLMKKSDVDYGFFLSLIKRLKLEPQECLFVDDREKHIETAKKLGFKTCLFSKTEDLEKCLTELS